MAHKNLSVAIQAGGTSTRMGEDKGLINFKGYPLVEYLLNQVKDFGAETFIISNRPEEYLRFGFPVFEDVIKNKGALGGLYSALYYAAMDEVIVLACDMPFIHLPFFDDLSHRLSGHDAFVPRFDKKHLEPFRALYSKTCEDKFQKAIDAGKLKVRDVLISLQIKYLDLPDKESNPELNQLFFNINTQQDLLKAEEIAAKLGTEER